MRPKRTTQTEREGYARSVALTLGFVVLIISAIHVGVDARRLRVYHGCLGGGIMDMSVTGWVLGVLLLWAVYYPWYVFRARPRYVTRATGLPNPLLAQALQSGDESTD
jgi:hypothetical protein